MATHTGSKVVPQPPNILRSIRRVQQDLQAMRSRTRPEVITFAPSDQTRGVPCTSGTMANNHETLIYRSGATLYVDLAAWVGTGSVLEFSLKVPDVSVTGDAAQTAAGGASEQIVRVTFTFPDTWLPGDAHLLYVQGRRLLGTDSTTVRVLRAVQR